MNENHRMALQKATLFQDISDVEFNTLIKCLTPQIKTYAKKEIILLTGDFFNRLGIILDGTAVACLEHIDGNQAIMANLTPGRVFGEILVSTRTHQSPVTVHATTDVSVAFIEYGKLYDICTATCGSHIAFLQNMHKVIGDNYFRLFDRINILSEKSLRSKILSYLKSLSSRGKMDVVTIPFSKTALADYLLSNRSALSKELHKMENEGLIVVNGRKIKLL